jgi:hypothetical protein
MDGLKRDEWLEEGWVAELKTEKCEEQGRHFLYVSDSLWFRYTMLRHKQEEKNTNRMSILRTGPRR